MDMDVDIKVKNDSGVAVDPGMIKIMAAVIAACDEAGLPRSYTIEVEPLEGGESKS